jgi:hypothetical protein
VACPLSIQSGHPLASAAIAAATSRADGGLSHMKATLTPRPEERHAGAVTCRAKRRPGAKPPGVPAVLDNRAPVDHTCAWE